MTQRQDTESSQARSREQMASLQRSLETKSLSPLSQEEYSPYNTNLMDQEMRVYERNATGDLKFLQKIELDFLPDNPCTPSTPTQLTLAITPGGDLLVTGAPNVKTATNHDPEANVHSKIVRIPIAQLGDKFFGGGSGATAKPVVEDVLMDFTGKLNGATTTVEVSYSDSDWIYSTSWRAVGLTRCKLS